MIEFSLMLPWLIFLFVGSFDWGYYSHALISVESATRVAALYGANAANGNVSQSAACTLVLGEMSIAPNVGNLTGCTGSIGATQSVILTPTCPAPSSSLGNVNYVQIDLYYQTVSLIPIPGILRNSVILHRAVQMPMNGNQTCSIVS